MKRTLSAVGGILLIVALISCGGYLSTDTSLVTITIGSDQTASISAEKTTVPAKLLLLLDKIRAPQAWAYIPSQVETVRITVEADDMETIIRSENVSGQSSVSITIEVPNGMSRHLTVKSMDNAGYLIYMGSSDAIDLNGEPVSLLIDMIYVDDLTSPNFGGMTAAAGNGSTGIDISWTEATDDLSASADIVYLVYISTTSGGQNFAIPGFTTSAGVTTYTITGLQSATEYFIVVRARDEVGNVDTNTTELSATAPDTQPPTFGGADGTTGSGSWINLIWTEATDDASAPADIVYLIYMSTTTGGQDLTAADFTTASGATTYSVTGLHASTTYYFVVRAMDEAGNIDTNVIEQSDTTMGGG